MDKKISHPNPHKGPNDFGGTTPVNSLKAVLSTPVNAGNTRHASITQSSEAGSTVHAQDPSTKADPL